jgi:RNA polymerase sigma factor, sigma-70 family
MLNFRTDILPLKNQLYRLALRITLNTAEAEDIVQETLIKVWNKRDTWDQIDNIEAFCFTVCRNLSLDSIKRHDNQNKTLDDKGGDHIDLSNDPSRQTIVNDQMNMVRQIVDSLPEKQRSCIQLRDFEGKTYKDIALVLGISEEQVKVNIFRGRQTIKQRFEKLDNFEKGI